MQVYPWGIWQANATVPVPDAAIKFVMHYGAANRLQSVYNSFYELLIKARYHCRCRYQYPMAWRTGQLRVNEPPTLAGDALIGRPSATSFMGIHT